MNGKSINNYLHLISKNDNNNKIADKTQIQRFYVG